MPARIRIIQRTALHIIISVQRQRIRDVPQIRILRHKVRRRRTVISCPQILDIHVRIVGFRVIAVDIVILRLSEGDVSIRIIPVRLPDHALAVGDSGDAASRVVGIVTGPAGEPLIGQTFIAVTVRGIHNTIDVQLHQDFRMLPVHIVDILDQLVVLLLAGGLDQVDQFLLKFRYFTVNREQDSALVGASIGIGGIAAGSSAAVCGFVRTGIVRIIVIGVF